MRYFDTTIYPNKLYTVYIKISLYKIPLIHHITKRRHLSQQQQKNIYIYIKISLYKILHIILQSETFKINIYKKHSSTFFFLLNFA